MKSKTLPPTYFMALLVLSAAFHFVYPIVQVIHPPYTYLGILPIAFGAFLNVWADSLFKKRKTTVKPYEMPTSLVVSGPFRISRHPMYMGMEAVLLGEAILLGSLATFAFPVLFVVMMEVMFIPPEEENMEQAFEEVYLDYKKKVRRWV